jgi:hypothetical protein
MNYASNGLKVDTVRLPLFPGIQQLHQNQPDERVSGESEVKTRANNLPTATTTDSEAVSMGKVLNRR